MTPVWNWLVITQSCALWNTTPEQFWVMTQKFNRRTFRAHFGISLFACSHLNSQMCVTYWRKLQTYTHELPVLHQLRSLEQLQCFIFLSLKDLKQKQMSPKSAKFRSWKQKLNRITGAKLFTFNESDFFFFSNYSITQVHQYTI